MCTMSAFGSENCSQVRHMYGGCVQHYTRRIVHTTVTMLPHFLCKRCAGSACLGCSWLCLGSVPISLFVFARFLSSCRLRVFLLVGCSCSLSQACVSPLSSVGSRLLPRLFRLCLLSLAGFRDLLLGAPSRSSSVPGWLV